MFFLFLMATGTAHTTRSGCWVFLMMFPFAMAFDNSQKGDEEEAGRVLGAPWSTLCSGTGLTGGALDICIMGGGGGQRLLFF